MAKDLYAYLMVRTDLPSLGVGKAYAHSMHAGNQMTWREVVEPLMNGNTTPHLEDIKAWHAQGSGFGTTVALGKEGQMDLATIRAVVLAATNMGFVADLVEDPTYPYLVDLELSKLIDPKNDTLPPVSGPRGYKVHFRKEVTTAYVFGDKEPLRILMGQFGLVPNE